MKKIMLTQQGAEKLREELKWLRQEERPRAIEAITVARDSSDFQERSVYVQVVERQQSVERRIAELESKLANAEIVDVEKVRGDSRVGFGALVTLRMDPEGEPVCYRIVGGDEADIRTGKLSVSSPLARALLGRVEGESVTVETPGGRRAYRILRVRYGK